MTYSGQGNETVAFDEGRSVGERPLTRAVREAALLRRVAHLISSDISLPEILEQLLEMFGDLIPIDRMLVMEGVSSEQPCFWSFPEQELDSETEELLQNFSRRALQTATAVYFSGDQIVAPQHSGKSTEGLHARALIVAPLLQHGTASGVLIVETYHVPGCFDEQDVSLVEVIARQVATLLERDRAILESRRRMDQMGAFSAVTSTVNEWVDVEQLARRFLSVFLNTTHTNVGLFYLMEAEEEMHLVASFGVPPELVDELRLGTLSMQPDARRAFEKGRPAVIDDLQRANLSQSALAVAAMIPIRTIAMLPLRVKGRGMGMIVLGKPEGRIEIEDREFVQGLGDQAAQAIENARLFAESQRRFQEQSALRELAQRFLSAVTPDEVLERTLDTLGSLLPGDYYEILLPDSEGGFLLVNGRGWRRGVVGRTRTMRDPHLHAGYVLRAQMPMIVENFTSETRFQPSDYLMRHQVLSGVCAPMLAETRVIGLLGVYSRSVRQFSEEQSHFLYLVATQTAMALEKARHSQSAARRLDELILLNDVIAAANSEVSLDRVLESVAAEIRELLQSDDVRVYFAEGENGNVTLRPALPDSSVLPQSNWSQPVAEWVLRERDPLLIQDLARDMRFNASAYQVHACLGAPMTIGERVIGVVTVAHPEAGRFDSNDLRLLTTLAGQIAAAIERARLLDETAKRLAEISAMFEFSDKLRTATTEARLFELTIKAAVSMLHGAGGSLQVLTQDGETLRVMAEENMPHVEWQVPRRAGGLSWSVCDSGEALVIEDVMVDPRAARRDGFNQMHGAIVAPLRTPSGLLGTVLIGFAERGMPSQDQVRLAVTLANLAAQALQRLRLHEQTLQQAASLVIALNDLEESYQATLLALSAALDARDRETEGHSQRVTKLALAIGRQLALSDEELTNLERGALLHDVGKIGITDNILRKTGPLNPDERALMNRHPQMGFEMLKNVPFLQGALPVVLHHQEMWDGSGYPKGLKGAEIPLGARIFSVADTYDAMTSTRPYRIALAHDKAVQEIVRCRGTQFDPMVVDAFLQLFDKKEAQ